MSDYFIKTYAENCKDDMHRFMDMIMGGYTGDKLRYVMNSQTQLRQQMQEFEGPVGYGLKEKSLDNISGLYAKIITMIKEHGDLVIAQTHMDRKLDDVIKEQTAIRNELTAHRDNTEVHAQKARAKKSLGE